MTRPEITVMGAGIFGLTIAWVLSQRGALVQVLDKRGLGAGASGGPLGALAPHTPELWNTKKAVQLESLLMGPQFWAEVAEAAGQDTGYGRTGRLMPLAHDRAVAQAQDRALFARDIWQGQAVWEVIARPLSQWSPPSASGFVVYESLTARIDPMSALTALAKAITAQGGEVILGQKALSRKAKGSVIWATGYEGLIEAGADLGQSLGVGEKGQAMLLDFSAPNNAPQLFVDGVHFVPHSNGTLAIGSTRERYWEIADQPDHHLDALYQKALTIFPFLKGANVLKRWGAVRPRSNSRAPFLGAWPNREGHFMVNGGFKIGIAMAPRLAQMMADLVLDEQDNVPHDLSVAANFGPL
ncbi:MAG: FAD-binding oxidoreductase [Paracoccaceae bacterium]|jgi:glycine oxidase|nr:FAD-binding oxidoreductase [Paracoccaceae bacterium]HCM99658.1 FAD-dependent oxidoreductase [Rhodobacter sp.]MDO7568439.1 FAD-binding oxidoreductase [Paracoccaceae bacterium]MDO7633163.1 FAD-binding oxidoreductase [Paracoccaceae bacterium]MDO7654895.1 FAD-binding oxidoreductase [Paracoccaceae bacterium]